jgi:hypothetical protein
MSVTVSERIFHSIEAAGDRGRTIDELANGLNILTQSVCGSIDELRRQGRIVNSGRQRLNPSGRRAICWTVPSQKHTDQGTLF